ncbi:MAG: hypothetical protein ACPGXY_03960 [Alphaproteobacteria bacterium]
MKFDSLLALTTVFGVSVACNAIASEGEEGEGFNPVTNQYLRTPDQIEDENVLLETDQIIMPTPDQVEEEWARIEEQYGPVVRRKYGDFGPQMALAEYFASRYC